MYSAAIRIVLFVFLFIPISAMAQSASPPASTTSGQLLKAEELEALVAPVALYPDTLLSLVLMASTYPLEVVQAERWANENKKLKGDQLKAAVDKQAWDESVKSLAATPSVLTMMSTKLDWTHKLGDAVLAQQADVMDAIQRMRSRAQANNKLASTKEQTVTVKKVENKQVIVIEPTQPNTIHVPYYNPSVVYGAWPYASYPPYYFPPPPYIGAGIVATGLAFGAGYALGRWASGGNYWGGGCNWGGNNLVVNRPVNINNSGNNWQHKSEHRQGVRYSNRDVQQRFGNNNVRAGSQERMDFRGRSGEQVLKPGGDRSGTGDRGAADRGRTDRGTADRGTADRGRTDRGAANRGQGQRASSGSKPSAGSRPSTGTRPSGGAQASRRDSAFGNAQSGRTANLQSQRGQASFGGGGGGMRAGGAGGGMRAGGGGGGMRAGGRGGGGGRRSDIRLKHDVVLLGHLESGLGFYRFVYNGGYTAYVGVIAQEVLSIQPAAVSRDPDGYLRVRYDLLGLKFQSYQRWIASGGHVPVAHVDVSIAQMPAASELRH
jgi:hypothetical protein